MTRGRKGKEWLPWPHKTWAWPLSQAKVNDWCRQKSFQLASQLPTHWVLHIALTTALELKRSRPEGEVTIYKRKRTLQVGSDIFLGLIRKHENHAHAIFRIPTHKIFFLNNKNIPAGSEAEKDTWDGRVDAHIALISILIPTQGHSCWTISAWNNKQSLRDKWGRCGGNLQ